MTHRNKVALGFLVALGLPSLASANLLTNAGFEDGPPGFGAQDWIAFGNVFTEANTPLSGAQHAKLFGNFNPGFDVTGIFQEFPATPGSLWELDVWSRHNDGDQLTGVAGTGNWAVQKIVFKDAGDAEIGAVESIVLDGTFPIDVWIDNAPIQGVAPAGTTQVEAFVLFLQPAQDGGAALIDDAAFVPEPAAFALVALGGILALRRR